MEEVPNTFSALFYGYSALWVLLLGYIISLGIRICRIEKQLHDRRQGE